jgi:uncharacterized protein YkvS
MTENTAIKIAAALEGIAGSLRRLEADVGQLVALDDTLERVIEKVEGVGEHVQVGMRDLERAVIRTGT